MVASLPELVKRSCSTDGTRATISSASATAWRLRAGQFVPSSMAERAASRIGGYAFPWTRLVKFPIRST
jgi:hypothetical protein